MFKFQLTDGGQLHTQWKRESNTCSVRAISLACNIPFHEAYAITRSAGRKPGRRVRTFDVLNGIHKHGIQCDNQSHLYFQMTVNQLSQMLPSGRYIIRTKGHVFAVINGTIYDTYCEGKRRKVLAVWKIEQRG